MPAALLQHRGCGVARSSAPLPHVDRFLITSPRLCNQRRLPQRPCGLVGPSGRGQQVLMRASGKSPGDDQPSTSGTTSSEELDAYQQAMINAVGGKCLSACFIYVLAFFLASLADIDPYANFRFDLNQIGVGVGLGLPVGLLFSSLFAAEPPSLGETRQPAVSGLGSESEASAAAAVASLPSTSTDCLNKEQLAEMRKIDDEDAAVLQLELSVGESTDLPSDPVLLRRGLWWYAMSVLKPWYPAFDDSTVRSVFAATCLASTAQELFLRGYFAALFAGWYAGWFSGATGPDNALFWVKVLRLVDADTPRWLAAATLTAVQITFSIAPARRSQRVVREGLDVLRLGSRVLGPDGKPQRMLTASRSFSPGGPEEGRVGTAAVAPITYEDQVVFAAGLGSSLGITLSTNLAFALTGNLAASLAAQLTIDALVTSVQQWRASRLPVQVTMGDILQEQKREAAFLSDVKAAVVEKVEQFVKEDAGAEGGSKKEGGDTGDKEGPKQP